MKNFDPYKRTILFFASMINVCMMTALFSYSWYHFYADMMYTYRFYRRGNYVVLALYAVLLFFLFQYVWKFKKSVAFEESKSYYHNI